MVAQGQPVLAVHRLPDNNIYQFRFKDGVGFVLQSSFWTGIANSEVNGGQDGISRSVPMHYTKDGFLLSRRLDVNNGWTFELRDLSGNLVGSTQEVTNVPVASGLIYSDISLKSDLVVVLNASTALNSVMPITNVGVRGLSPSSLPISGATLKVPRIHPNDDYVFVARNNGGDLYKRSSVDPSYNRPIFGTTTFYTIPELAGRNINDAHWSSEGDNLFVGDSLGNVLCFQLNRATDKVDFIYSLRVDTVNRPIRYMHTTADGRFFAVSYFDGATYYINVYRRYSFGLVYVQTMTGAGRSFDFTQDGKLIVDATAQRCFVFNAHLQAYEENFTYMSAMTGYTIVAQTLSTHLASGATLGGRSYAASGKALLENDPDFNLSTVKLMLLTSDSSYDATNDEAVGGSLLGTFEIFGGNWPDNGVLLTGVSRVTDPLDNNAVLLADNLSVALTSSLTFRAFVVYEVTTNYPIAYYRLDEDITLNAPVTLTFNFEDNGVLIFTA